MLEAAAAGLGVAIAPAVLVEAELHRGRLAALGFVDSGAAFSLCTLKAQDGAPRAGAAARLAAGRRGGGVNAGGRTGANDAADGRAQVCRWRESILRTSSISTTPPWPRLRPDRTRLRTTRPGITALHGDPDVARQVLQLPYPSLERWRKRMEQDSERRVGLVASVQGEVAGYASLEQFERVRRSHCGSVGIAVAKGWHGQGIGSRLLGALLDVADNWMNLRRVELMVYTDNEPAIALYRKHGFEVEGELRDYAVRDGRHVNAYAMARVARRRPALNAGRAAGLPTRLPWRWRPMNQPARPARRQQRRRPQESRGPVGRLERPAPHLENAGQRRHRGAQGPEEAAQHDAQHAPALDESRRAAPGAAGAAAAPISSAGPTFTPSA